MKEFLYLVVTFPLKFTTCKGEAQPKVSGVRTMHAVQVKTAETGTNIS